MLSLTCASSVSQYLRLIFSFQMVNIFVGFCARGGWLLEFVLLNKGVVWAVGGLGLV